MVRKFGTHKAVSLGISALLASTPAFGIVIGGTNYVPTTPTETLSAVFTDPDGGVSTFAYSGFVQVQVTGIGNAYFAYLNDAFHVFDPGPAPASDDGYYQLTFSRSTLTGFTTTQDAANYIVYDLDADLKVTAPYTPTYRADHSYRFVLAVGSPPIALHFGVADGLYSDNGGSFTLTLQQLAERSIPEPSTFALLGLGLAGLAASRRRKQ